MSASETPLTDALNRRQPETAGLKELCDSYNSMLDHARQLERDLTTLRERLAAAEAALETLLAKCPNCGGTGMVETGRIQFGYPSDSPCGLCANERKVFDAAIAADAKASS